jgi:hypothetical protein
MSPCRSSSLPAFRVRFERFQWLAAPFPSHSPSLRVLRWDGIVIARSDRATRRSRSREAHPQPPGLLRHSPSEGRSFDALSVAMTRLVRFKRNMLQPDLPAFLKNNTKSKPTWQEIVDFSHRASGSQPGALAAPQKRQATSPTKSRISRSQRRATRADARPAPRSTDRVEQYSRWSPPRSARGSTPTPCRARRPTGRTS